MNDSRGFEFAKKASEFSDYPTFHLGCCAVYKNKQEIVNIPVKLTNYKSLTGIEAWSILSEQVFTESMVLSVWNKLGIRLGFTVPILRCLN